MNKKVLSKILLCIYFILLIWLVVFKLNFSFEDIHKVRDINLIPFHYENVIEGDIPLFEAFLNLVVFVPLGFLLHRAFRWKVVGEILVLAGISLIFETTQYILAIGATDITDLITNTLGGIIGVCVAVWSLRIKKSKDK